MGASQHRCSARYRASGMMPRSPHTSISVGPHIPYTVLSLVSLTPRTMATVRSSPWMTPGSHDSHTPCLHLSTHLPHVPQTVASNWAMLPSGAKSLSHGGLRSPARRLVIFAGFSRHPRPAVAFAAGDSIAFLGSLRFRRLHVGAVHRNVHPACGDEIGVGFQFTCG